MVVALCFAVNGISMIPVSVWYQYDIYDQFNQNADVCYFSNSILKRQFIKNLTNSELRNAEFLLELLSIREEYSALPFEFLNSVQLNDIIADVATN